MAVLTHEELQQFGFVSIGNNVRISNKASIHGAQNISIGNDVRIDDFCVLSAGKGGITIGNNIHIAVYSSLIGKGSIVLEDFSNISSRVAIYSSNDDYSGEFMTNPTVESIYTNVISDAIHIGKHVVIGSGSVILPGVNLDIGTVIGALSLVKSSSTPFTILGGVPAKKIGVRSKNLLKIEKKIDENR
ncbi:acyltransferase [Vibrio sp. Isolate34]|uniref:acyltransferase n=1 Tax=Vibrio sp. Isolate34 TaxID=2908540 RepID=UPI001EFD3CD6|nr:acyltransferase [Vibrio sp. Isolate34]MCG9639520.1 acyltransferase [Vibrio sp. Isolate34]